MKRTMFVLMAVACVAMSAYAWEAIITSHADVSLSSSAATLIHAPTEGRKRGIIVNDSANWVRIGQSSSTITTASGMPLAPWGTFVDDFYVNVSSWYGISLGTGTAAAVNFTDEQ